VTAQLLTFTNVTDKVFDRTQRAVIDVTAKLNGLNASEEQLRSTSIQLGKVLNDPIANLGQLSRSGIQFSDAQKAMIKSMVETNNLVGAQDLILTEIEKQYGGTAAAIAKTAGGIEMSVKNMIGDTKELIGKGLSPIKLELLSLVQKTLPKLLPAITKMTDGLKKGMEIAKRAWAGFLQIIEPAIPVFVKVKDNVDKLIKSVFGLAKTIIDGLIPSGKEASNIFVFLGNIINSLVKIMSEVIKFVTPIAASLMPLIKAVFDLGKVILDSLIPAGKESSIIFTALGVVLSATINVITKVIKFLTPIIKKLMPLIKMALMPFIELPALIIKNWEPIKGFFVGIWEGITNGLRTAIGFMKRIFFIFADVLLTTFGNIIRTILSTAGKVGKFLGFDTTGLDKVVSKIDDIQKKVRLEAMGVEEGRAPGSDLGREFLFRGQLDIKTEGGTAQFTRGDDDTGDVDVDMLGAN
jgi:phage-related protein